MRTRPLGDRAMLIELGDRPDEAARRLVQAARARLAAAPPAGTLDIVAGLASVVVHYDPAVVQRAPDEPPHAAMRRALEPLLDGLALAPSPEARLTEIPVCYDPAVAPDLDDVARHAVMATDEVVALHVAAEYVVHMVGFLPGFPYLAGLDPRLATPRRATPRVKVPAGSVGIGGSLAGIYPVESPGGWQLIGRTSAALFLPDRDPPALLRVGDRVRFRRVSIGELQAAGR